MPDRVVLTHESPPEFFRAALVEAMARCRVVAGPYTEYYLVNLLVSQVRGGHDPDMTLADRYCKAAVALPAERVRILREIGDAALVICGLWADRELRLRHPLDVRYHSAMGRAAYYRLSHEPAIRVQAFGLDLFGELHDQFQAFVDAFNDVSTQHSLATTRGVLQLYERWQKTGSAKAARTLSELGVDVSRWHIKDTPS